MLKLMKPTLEELVFKQHLVGDKETMSFNQVNGGKLDFPKERWETWYHKWIASDDPNFFYRYLYSEELETNIGEVAYHYEENTDRFVCDVIILAEYRGRGFGKNGLDLLCDSAKKNGVNVLYDDILSNNPSVNLFLKNGFELIYSNEEINVVKREL